MVEAWGLEPKLQAAYKRLESYYPERISPDLRRIHLLLDALGCPHHKLPPVIHVAGTNGKGSTCAYLRSMCAAAGLRVHVYTSPHLIRFNERIRLAGDLITDADLLHYIERVEAALTDNGITFFEATTTAAMLAFSEVEADVTILEVGMGGRLDATNIIPDPLMSIITPIGKDHEGYLGNTIEEIAREKCGIIRQNGCVLTNQPDPIAEKFVQSYCFEKSAAFHELERSDLVDIPDELPLFGSHQRHNAALAAKALRLWQPDIFTPQKITQGAQSAVWPARLQPMEPKGVFSGVNADIWLDGGHNPQAAGVVASALSGSSRPLTLICAMLERKDAEGFFDQFSRFEPKVLTLENPGGRPFYAPKDLADIALALGLDAAAMPSLEAAIDHEWSKIAGTILICGSLYLAGEVLRQAEYEYQ